MANDQSAAGVGGELTAPSAGTGGLAQVIATRGGLAAPEAPFVIEHREALIYMLCEAAELEHGIMCQYLFAAFSLKQNPDEGLSGTELDAVRRWRKQIAHVAAQEMLHLALVHNLLSAIGAAPHMARPNLPAPASHYPAGVQLALLPFGEPALRHFMFLERPEGMDLADAEGLAAVGRAAGVMSERDIVPHGQDFATVGHLYRSIEAGFAHLAEKHGEDWLFVGPPRAQATQAHFHWPELIPVTDLASAQRAIEEILEQGEGPRGHWRDAHFGQFVSILDQYQRLRAANPGFDPVRPVMAANVRPAERDVDVPLIGDRLTARVVDLFNVGYEILLQIFERFFAHTEETDAQLTTLADATIRLMVAVIKPLGDLITTLPVGTGHPGMTAGPSFELFYESDYLMPHREAAWALLAERLDTAAWLCGELRSGRGSHLTGQLTPVLAAMQDIAASLAAHLPGSSPHAGLVAAAAPIEPAGLAALTSRARKLADAVAAARAGAPADGLGEIFEAACSIVLAAGNGSHRHRVGSHPEMIVPRLVSSVLAPLAAALTAQPAAPGPARAADPGPTRAADPGPAQPDPSPGQPGELTSATSPGVAHPDAGEPVWETARAATRLRASLGRAGTCPPELAEATAALQDLAIRLAAPADRAPRLAELWELLADLPATVQAAPNGPYLVTNVPQLIDHLGNQARPAPQLALCRCGESAAKPLCDGSHTRIRFSGAKDPKRVPDQRDTYAGQQLTIFDNRGICQHSGLCTDRLAAVFRTGTEPFVAPSGARMDEIIRAVRDCPSGALSYAIDGIEAREQVDWGGTRPPAIEVTRDGPYRITGQITLLGGTGAPERRNDGASLEHCALCRCGHSQNKPFCSGMHWYVGFADPVPPAGHEPTLFEWAGGFPALTRMARLFYEKHVPADPLLAPAFAGMAPGQPQRLAAWLAEALGGPARADGGKDFREAGLAPPAGRFTSGQRSRWVALLHNAADEAGLPGEPEFRSVFSACAEWGSRAAAAQSEPGAAPSPPPATPRWDWGPAGPPATAGQAAGEAGTADGPLPGPGEPVGFAEHIKPLFRERDRQSMSFGFDLWSYDDVRARAAGILARLQDGSMPCDGAWPATRIEVFQRWTRTGMRP
jgi:CDGSH-type Zn-finger protein/truncated hemoglobin YjbI